MRIITYAITYHLAKINAQESNLFSANFTPQLFLKIVSEQAVFLDSCKRKCR